LCGCATLLCESGVGKLCVGIGDSSMGVGGLLLCPSTVGGYTIICGFAQWNPVQITVPNVTPKAS